jgi:hypothetical protein
MLSPLRVRDASACLTPFDGKLIIGIGKALSGCVWACSAAAMGWFQPVQVAREQLLIARCGIEHSGNPAGFRPKGRAGDPQDV